MKKLIILISVFTIACTTYSQRTIDSVYINVLVSRTKALTENNEIITIRPLTRKQAQKIAFNYLKLRLGKFETFKGRPFSSAYINDCWIFKSDFNSLRRKRVTYGGGGYIIINNRNGKVESLIIYK